MKMLEPFSRVTTAGRNFIPQIDGLRFIAIMAVLAFHVREIVSFHFGVNKQSAEGSAGMVNSLFAAGHFGVQLFFAISGFILVLPFAKYYLQAAAPVSLRAYFLRRITRLEPPYIIQLGFLAVLCALVYRHVPAHSHLYHNEHWLQYALMHLTASLFYVNGFIFGTHPYPNIVLWSLEVEVQFYILAPFLACLFKISRTSTRRLVIVGLILTVLLLNTFLPQTYAVTFSLLGNLQYFLIGFLLCDFYLIDWGNTPARSRGWDSLVLGVGVATICLHRQPYFGLLFPWLVLLCGCAAFRGRFFRLILSNPWVSTIGGMCYTIYMYHWLMISGLIRGTGRLQTHIFWLDLIIQFVIMAVIIIALCAILFAIFERPFMRRDWPVKFQTAAKKLFQQA